MLTPIATTNLAQKHLKILLSQWQYSKDASLKSTLEMSFILMMNRALGSLLLEIVPDFANKDGSRSDDFVSLIEQPLKAELKDQTVTQLADNLCDPMHWLFQWHQSWQTMNYVPVKTTNADVHHLIATESTCADLSEIESWYNHFNELVENLRSQNEYY